MRRAQGQVQETGQQTPVTMPLLTDDVGLNPPPPPIEPDLGFSSVTMGNDGETPEEEDLSHIALAEVMKKLAVNASIDVRYFGEARLVVSRR